MAEGWEAPTRARWVHAVNLMLGAWLVTSPALGYTSEVMARSDLVAGLVLMVAAALGLRFPAARYVPAFVGLWLVLAPLLFWSPDAVAYVNDTLVGAMVLALTLLVPHSVANEGADRPPGWSYNPSSWPQRVPVLILGGIGFLVARSLAAFQLGYTDRVWDPFFDGADQVLLSSVAQAWPISDAGIGGLACLAAILVGFLGDRGRWHTMPWLVVLFGVLVVPLALYGLLLVALQPLAVGAWCTPCLVVSGAVALILPFAVDELVATAQYLRWTAHRGRSAWWTFWLGGPSPDTSLESPPDEEHVTFANVLRGVGAPLPLLGTILVGAGLVAVPGAHLAGALVIAIGVLALAEVARPLRYLVLPIGLWLLIAPWIVGTEGAAAWLGRLGGLLLLVLALPTGTVREHYGRLDRALIWPLRAQ